MQAHLTPEWRSQYIDYEVRNDCQYRFLTPFDSALLLVQTIKYNNLNKLVYVTLAQAGK